MMKFLLAAAALALALVMLSGCELEKIEYRYVVPVEKREACQAWVAECIKTANPKSDEEPEDWIRQCEHTSERLFGVRTKGISRGCCGDWYWEPLQNERVQG